MNLGTGLFPTLNEAPPAPGPRIKPRHEPQQIGSADAAAVAATLQQLIDDLPEEIALLDDSCTILAVNRTWREIGEQYGYLESLPGHNYRTLCVNRAAEGYEPAAKALVALDDMVSGKMDFWHLVYNGGERWNGRQYEICYHRIQVGEQSIISITRYDLTEVLELRRLRDDPKPIPRPDAGPVSEAIFAETIQELVSGFSEQVAVVDEDWTIIAANEAWQHMVDVSGYPELKPGFNYRDFLEQFSIMGQDSAEAVRVGIAAIHSGENNAFELTYAGADRWEGRTHHLRVNRLHLYGRVLATITREDLTSITDLSKLREEISGSVMRGQVEERQRMGRELHDSTSQLLASLGLLLGRLKRDLHGDDCSDVVDELQSLLSEAHQEIRSVSYLSQPPALEKMSFGEALKALCEGFASRTELGMSLHLQEDLRLSRSQESALYRVVQEALANIHWHSRASHAAVCIYARQRVTHVVVADDGIGIKPDARPGVGLPGMRSRLSELGGRLSIHALSPGTGIIATIRHSRGAPFAARAGQERDLLSFPTVA